MYKTDWYNEIFINKKRVLVVMAHPDDAEVFAGGTIARLIKNGIEVRVVTMSCGNKGSRGNKTSSKNLAKMRLSENQNSMKVLGVKKENLVCLNIDDGYIENDIPTIGLIAEQIRIFKPDLIITHNGEDIIIRMSTGTNWVNHRDHRNTGKSTIDAAYPYSRDLLFFPEHFKNKNSSSHIVTEFLITDSYNHPDNISINVTDFFKQKVNALKSHSSQYSPDDALDECLFFTNHPSGTKIEQFRYVTAD